MKTNSRLKDKFNKLWGGLTTFNKNFLFLVGFSAAMTPIINWLGNKFDEKIGVYFDQTEVMMNHWPVLIGAIEGNMKRIHADHNHYAVLEDGLKREAYLFEALIDKKDPETGRLQKATYVFLEDDLLGVLPFAAYYNPSRDVWYFYSFGETSFTIIYKK